MRDPIATFVPLKKNNPGLEHELAALIERRVLLQIRQQDTKATVAAVISRKRTLLVQGGAGGTNFAKSPDRSVLTAQNRALGVQDALATLTAKIVEAKGKLGQKRDHVGSQARVESRDTANERVE